MEIKHGGVGEPKRCPNDEPVYTSKIDSIDTHKDLFLHLTNISVLTKIRPTL